MTKDLSYFLYFLLKINHFKLRLKVFFSDRSAEFFNFKKPCIFIFWHHDIPLILHTFKHNGIFPMISSSRDGIILEPVLRRYGYGIIRGSSSKGAYGALDRAISLIKNGKSIAITPDGPRGPRYSFKNGPAYIAQRTAVPVIPLAASIHKKKTIRTWDEIEFSLPLSRAVIYIGDPLYYDREISLNENVRIIKESLFSVEKHSEKLLRKILQ